MSCLNETESYFEFLKRKEKIKLVVGVTGVTLRSRYKELLQNIKLITYN